MSVSKGFEENENEKNVRGGKENVPPLDAIGRRRTDLSQHVGLCAPPNSGWRDDDALRGRPTLPLAVGFTRPVPAGP